MCRGGGSVLYPRNDVHIFDHFFAATLRGATPSSLSALQQEALYISRSVLSGLEPIGEGMCCTSSPVLLNVGTFIAIVHY